MRNMKNPLALLGDIARGLKGYHKTDVGCLEVLFWKGKKNLHTTSLDDALLSIAEDLTWDAEENWADADSATVQSF